jgi:hypothetical protein
MVNNLSILERRRREKKNHEELTCVGEHTGESNAKD